MVPPLRCVSTPAVLLLDAVGKEPVRLECYLPNNDFVAALKNGLGGIAFVQKRYPVISAAKR